jgi:hypothetical protein
LFSYVDVEARIERDHPLRLIREVVNEALGQLDGAFAKLYAREGRPSIAPERLLRASLLQLLYSIRSERQLMEGWSSICCSAGSWGSASTIRCGMRVCSRRTGSVCSTPISP